jgi:hypothetical protein
MVLRVPLSCAMPPFAVSAKYGGNCESDEQKGPHDESGSGEAPVERA